MNMNTTRQYQGGRFTLNYPPGVPKRNIDCPNCKQKNCFTPYFDNATGAVITEYGVCNRRNKCGYRAIPTAGEIPTGSKVSALNLPLGAQTAQTLAPNPETPPSYNIKLIDSYCAESKQKLFTLIQPSVVGENKDGETVHASPKALSHLTLVELVGLLNNLPLDALKNKLLRSNILKGLYPIGGSTYGANCIKPAPFLFFDIDLSGNPWLSDREKANTVYKFLNQHSLFTAISSGGGIFGCLYVPKLSEFTNDTRAEHKRLGEQVYAFISELAQMLLGIDIVFDNAQAAFRQVRLLAYQKNQVKLNLHCQEVVFEAAFKQYEYPKQALMEASLARTPQALLDFLLKLEFDKEAILAAFELYKVGSGADNSVWFWFLGKDSKPINAIIVQKEEFQVGGANFDFWESPTLGKTSGKHFAPAETLVYGDHLLNPKLGPAKKLYITETALDALIIHIMLKTQTVIAAKPETLASENCFISDSKVCLIAPISENGSVTKAELELIKRRCKVEIER